MRRPALFLLLCLLPGCSILDSTGGDPGTVSRPTAEPLPTGSVLVQDVAFTPREITVPAGQEVTWTVNDGGLGHTITADDGAFDSGRISAGEFKHTFGQAGTFSYHCNVHARMRGTVVVS